MSVQSRRMPQKQEAEPRERRRALSDVAARVRQDALVDPRRTLEEGKVPAGGE